jgi:alcohol dehydrogenase class IV
MASPVREDHRVNAFEFNSVGRIAFGCGTVARMGELTASFGRTALCIHNGEISERVIASLGKAGVAVTFHRQRGEPVVADVDRATEEARRLNCDVILGVGGGSAIDTAKAVAGLLGNGGSALDYMEVIGKGQKIIKPAMPWIAVPTTAGTGAEATRNAVVGFPEKKFKASIRSELLLPRIALIDPELGVGVPRDVTARSGMDALCQLIESYTSTGAQPITDGLAIKGIALAARSLERAFSDSTDIAARADMAMAALLSGITLTNVGLGAVHGFAAPLGASFPVPHGTACAALLPGVIAANVAALRRMATDHPTLSRYAEIGRIVAGRSNLADGAAIDACQEFTADLARRLAIPPLRQFGITSADVPEIVTLAQKASSMKFNPVKLSADTLADVLSAAL